MRSCSMRSRSCPMSDLLSGGKKHSRIRRASTGTSNATIRPMTQARRGTHHRYKLPLRLRSTDRPPLSLQAAQKRASCCCSWPAVRGDLLRDLGGGLSDEPPRGGYIRLRNRVREVVPDRRRIYPPRGGPRGRSG